MQAVLRDCLNDKAEKPARSTTNLYGRLIKTYFKDCYDIHIPVKSFVKVIDAQTTRQKDVVELKHFQDAVNELTPERLQSVAVEKLTGPQHEDLQSALYLTLLY